MKCLQKFVKKRTKLGTTLIESALTGESLYLHIIKIYGPNLQVFVIILDYLKVESYSFTNLNSTYSDLTVLCPNQTSAIFFI